MGSQPVGTIPHYRFQTDVYGELGRVAHEAKVELAGDSGAELRRLGGGTNKDVFVNDKTAEVFIIFTDPNNPAIMNPMKAQIAFYEQYNSNPEFQKLVVPITRILEDKNGQLVGMAQRYFGRGLNHFKETGGSMTPEEVDAFANNYKNLIRAIKAPHGNLITDGQLNLDQIRIDDSTHEVRFVGYNSNGGQLEMAHQIYKPGDPDYETVLNMNPDRLRSALYDLFGFHDRGAGNGSI